MEQLACEAVLSDAFKREEEDEGGGQEKRVSGGHFHPSPAGRITRSAVSLTSRLASTLGGGEGDRRQGKRGRGGTEKSRRIFEPAEGEAFLEFQSPSSPPLPVPAAVSSGGAGVAAMTTDVPPSPKKRALLLTAFITSLAVLILLVNALLNFIREFATDDKAVENLSNLMDKYSERCNKV